MFKSFYYLQEEINPLDPSLPTFTPQREEREELHELKSRVDEATMEVDDLLYETGSRQGSEPGPVDLKLDKHMKDSFEERDLFIEYSAKFGIKNPRKLKRLKNSYRFLKILNPEEDPKVLMLLLFSVETKYSQYDSDTLDAMVDQELKSFDQKKILLLRNRVSLLVLPRLTMEQDILQGAKGNPT